MTAMLKSIWAAYGLKTTESVICGHAVTFLETQCQMVYHEIIK